MDRLCAIRGLSTESIGARTIVKGVADITTDTTAPMVATGTPTLLCGSDGANLDSTGVLGHKKRRSLGFERQEAGLPGK